MNIQIIIIIVHIIYSREEAQNRLINMGDEDKQQVALHKAEVKELQRQYDRDLKLQDFLSVKGAFNLRVKRQKNEPNANYVI